MKLLPRHHRVRQFRSRHRHQPQPIIVGARSSQRQEVRHSTQTQTRILMQRNEQFKIIQGGDPDPPTQPSTTPAPTPSGPASVMSNPSPQQPTPLARQAPAVSQAVIPPVPSHPTAPQPSPHSDPQPPPKPPTGISIAAHPSGITPSPSTTVGPSSLTNSASTTGTLLIAAMIPTTMSQPFHQTIQPLVAPIVPAQRSATSSAQPSQSSNLLGAEGNGSNQSTSTTPRLSSSSMVTIGTIVSLVMILFCLLLRKRLREQREDAERRRLAQMDTKDSSFFGGSDQGDVEKAAICNDAAQVGTSASWVDGFMDHLSLPPVSAASRWSRRGSGWQILDEAPSATNSPVLNSGHLPPTNASGPQYLQHPPHVHFVDDPKFGRNRQQSLHPRSYYGYTSESDYKDSDCCSTESEAVITTASRVPTTQVFASTSPLGFNNRSHSRESYSNAGSYRTPSPSGTFESDRARRDSPPPRPRLMVVTPSKSNSSTVTSSSYARESENSRFENSGSHGTTGDTSDTWVTSDGFESAASAILARAREPLRVVNKPKKHQSLMYSPGSPNGISLRGEDEDLWGRANKLRRSNTVNDRYSGKTTRKSRQSLAPSTLVQAPSSNRPSRLSMGTVMLTSYGDEGAIIPPMQETPSIGNEDDPILDDDDEYEDIVLRPNPPPRRYSAPRSRPPSIPLPQLPPVPQSPFKAPHLTITSPSAGHLSSIDLTSSSSGEGAFLGLAQLALLKSQPNYRSPTYSIYHMYDGDDEHGRARASVMGRYR